MITTMVQYGRRTALRQCVSVYVLFTRT